MEGWLTKRRKGRHYADTVILRTGKMRVDKHGRSRPEEKWCPIGKCTKGEAEGKLTELLAQVQRQEFVEPSKMTVDQWMTAWLDTIIRPKRTAGTAEVYEDAMKNHIRPALGAIRLQSLAPLDLDRFYTTLARALAPATIAKIHVIIHGALKAAQRSGYVARNVATLVNTRPQRTAGETPEDVLKHTWQAHEARAFLEGAKAAGPQAGAFYALALDSGARKSELCGLTWADLDLSTGRLTIHRQLARHGPKGEDGAPVLVPTKTKAARTLDLGADTLDLLKAHRTAQAEGKMRQRTRYQDHGLMFAKTLGQPLQASNLGQREYAQLITAAKVRPIKFHGLRHTCATLLLSAGVPVHVVARRLGHRKIQTTLDIYGHVLPSMQQDAAAKLGALLHGRA